MKDWKPNDPRAIFTRGAVWQLHSGNQAPSVVSLDILDAIEKQAEKLFPDGKVPNGECAACEHEHLYKEWGKSCGVIEHLPPGVGTSPWGCCPCVEGQGWS